jgi:DNA polymerase III subunit alpha
MVDPFAHLHVHTEYSMLDGHARHDDLAAEVQRLGQPAVAMTDHGNMFGAYSFYQATTRAGVRPVLGVEAYVAPASRHTKKPILWGPGGKRAPRDADGESGDVSGGGAYTHMTLLARNAQGLRALYELTGRASLEGQYPAGKGRMDRELLAEVIGRRGQHIIATTGCPGGEVQTRLRLGQEAQALEAAAFWRDLFGADNYFLEVMDHGLGVERQTRQGLLRIGRELGLRPLATNDSHYVRAEDADAHDALLCIGTGSTLADEKRFRFSGNGYWIKPAAQMREMFDAEVPGACDNTLLVASMVESYEEVFAHRDRMPSFPVPDGHDEASWLRHLVDEGLQRRYGADPSAAVWQRAEYELDLVTRMGFAGYFLVVHDICQFMRERGIRFGPRGSAAGSIVVYALGVAALDPLRFELMFERFINPDRVSPPDIDIDIDEERRDEVVRYVVDTYGEDRVSQIITFGRIKARAALKDGARIEGLPYSVGDRASKAVPPDAAGFGVPLRGCFDPQHPRYGEAGALRDLAEADDEVAKVVQTALKVEGRVRNFGMHACGVILSAEPLLGQVPIALRLGNKDGEPDALLAGHEYPDLEAMGLQKMDLLGLRNWTVIDQTVKEIKARHGVDVDLDALGFDDPDVFAMLARGESIGVFQLEGTGIQSLLRAMKPTAFEDLMAVGALYRPGPMGMNSHTNYAQRKNGLQPITPIHPELDEPLRDILAPTYGVICFQEQVLQVAQQVAGFSLGRADLLRKAMGKKKKDVLDKEYGPFRDGMRANGYSDEAITALWDTLLPFALYAFNRAHTACYGALAYYTAWLKLHYPTEYMAALLTSVGDNKDKMALYLAECRRMGIQVLPPDVNDSNGPFTPADGNIRFGLAAVRNVGANVVAAIVRCRERGRYSDFYDFLTKADPVVCNKKTIESLIKAGAFDSMGHPRRALLAVHAEAVDACAAVKRNEAAGQFDLFGAAFGDAGTPVAMPAIGAAEWDKAQQLNFEREMLGLYVSDHPLRGVEASIEAAADIMIGALLDDEAPDGQTVTIAGILTGLQRRISGKGKHWASATLEDLTGSVETLFFPATFDLLGQYLAEDAIVVVKGRINRRDDGIAVVAMDLSLPDLTLAPPRVVLTIPVARCTPQLVDALKDVLWSYPGTTEVRVRLTTPTGGSLLRLKVRAAPTPGLEQALSALLGADNVEMPPPAVQPATQLRRPQRSPRRTARAA